MIPFLSVGPTVGVVFNVNQILPPSPLAVFLLA